MSGTLTRFTPRQWFRIENASDEAADIHIFDEISPFGVTAKDFVAELASVTQPTINLHLNTPGGDVFDGIAIFNALKAHPAKVNAYIPGLAASIGTVIAMAADTITIAPHARMMIHEAWGLAMGNADDMAKMAERLEATSQNIASIYAERVNDPDKDTDYWRDQMRAETWFTDKEAVTAGLADGVGRANDAALKEAALFDLSTFRHGDREAARLRAEAGVDTDEVLTRIEAMEARIAELTAQLEAKSEEAPTPPENTHVQERDELEAALAAIEI